MILQTLKQILKWVFISRPINFFVHQSAIASSTIQRSAAGQARLQSGAEAHCSPALLYTLLSSSLHSLKYCTVQVVPLFEEYG